MSQSKEERVHEVFENISDSYDKMNSVISFQLHKKWRKDTMNRMQVKPGSKALDVCCGTADWTITMAEAVGETGQATGLDFSQNMLNVGIEKTKSYPQINLLQGNAMELPFPDNSFDYVTIGFGLRNVPDYMQVLSEINRVLKPGGMAVCLETSQSEIPGYRQLFRLYFKYIMPIFGKLFAKSYKEYSWLQESADEFPGMKQLKKMFEQVGFENVKYKAYSGGAAAMHMGFKKEN
ncbi:demethylmenaquinone methyltransferase [Viridibacillus sp. FSL R5-0477]|uniref:Demethylmenaquinone methyltransferase n=1 Tax=Viridibacillus arenosi FSL R5-213 TaxID=1227360 RepID=W4EKQ5_9BACL|nr:MULTISPECIES: demethylmenaquinone methyltransferase [Viridibacillus]ETT81150.1 menaquinone biosynthesis methyltransferase ubiE [Viridibacillus arenosi FSL R5-213]OMC84095.1 bifunctional demethylmenaquinone methyltransferase/2-methoxy-6-polyprenyl-1,4-benzoquinol methylase [Viridibacillus sp. FSL H8-0123]OMC88618.1 bifunctional demethylmenaquinone methyltransferase/2-methoxy-6-polyprenyl-1,4-benzoquinol methylase [Viridibacillus sp. FSL H7-0596]OMC93251.1 bifunctional demethylmenaquinone meth